MTEEGSETNGAAVASAESVTRYLREHPEFFNHHPELLLSLEVPHATGQAVSLWERQITLLREENDKLKARFEQFLESARDNETLIRRLHQLALALMEAAGPQAVFGLLEQRLGEDFNADRVSVLVFGAPAFVDSDTVPQFVGPDSSRRAPFASLLAGREALCGRLTQAQLLALFADTAPSGSHVVMPLKAERWDGVLAISSHDAKRFDANMGTEFLAYLRDVVVLVLAPWIANPRPT